MITRLPNEKFSYTQENNGYLAPLVLAHARTAWASPYVLST
jgi:hypothetical protein